MDAAAYWELKAAVAACEVTRLQAAAAVEKAETAVRTLMTRAGLDPAISYQLDDATHSVTPPAPAS